ncbi:ABC-type multidrug transport system fused ATPase/permease subunit [Pedobacter sp. UYEF25]
MMNRTSSLYFFSRNLWKQISHTVVLLILVALLYVYLMQFIDHNASWIPYLVILLALLKSAYFTFFTFKQVNQSIKQCHSFGQLLWVFGLLWLLIVFSFAADFTCLAGANPNSFRGNGLAGQGYAEKLFDYFYFSVVTFGSVGYGDVVPLTIAAKFLVILEIGQSFVTIVFGLSNVNNIRTAVNK